MYLKQLVLKISEYGPCYYKHEDYYRKCRPVGNGSRPSGQLFDSSGQPLSRVFVAVQTCHPKDGDERQTEEECRVETPCGCKIAVKQGMRGSE